VQRTSTTGVLAVATAVLAFSITASLVKWSGTPGSVIAFWRMLAAIGVWWIIARVAGQPPTWRSLKAAFLPGMLFGVNIALFFTAITRTSVAHAEFLGSIAPLVLAPTGALVFGERVVWKAFAWGSIAIVGVSMVIFGGTGAGTATLAGDALALAAMLLWCGYLVASKRVRRTMGVPQFMASVTPIAAVALAVIVTVRGGATEITARGWVVVFALLVITGVTAQGLITYAQSHVPVATIAVMQVAQPALSVLWAALLIGESVRAVQVTGMVVVLVGLTLFTLRSSPRQVNTGARHDAGELAGPAG
jgi:drug/metabolite transporter (DMT)-like permease